MLGLAAAYLAKGEAASALSVTMEVLTLTRLAGYRLREGQALYLMAQSQSAGGDRESAWRNARAALEIHRDTGYRLGCAKSLALLAEIEDSQVPDISVFDRTPGVNPFGYAELAKSGRI